MPRHFNKLLTLTLCAFILLTSESLCSAIDEAPGAQELKRAEKVLAKLKELQTASTNPDTYKAVVRKLYPELFISVTSLREGFLKTDLATATFLYQKAYDFEQNKDATVADCGNEVRDLYRALCLKRDKQTRAQLSLAKAQLHTTWAEALIQFCRGNRDALTLATLSEIKTERLMDLALAARLTALLKTLNEEVNSYSSLADFEEHHRVAKVSFDKLSDDFETVAITAEQLLASLPRNLLYHHLQNALHSYSDGLFWWQKTHLRQESIVSVNNWTEPARQEPLGLDVETVNYTVVCHWRKARKHLADAAVEIERARNLPSDSDSIPESISPR